MGPFSGRSEIQTQSEVNRNRQDAPHPVRGVDRGAAHSQPTASFTRPAHGIIQLSGEPTASFNCLARPLPRSRSPPAARRAQGSLRPVAARGGQPAPTYPPVASAVSWRSEASAYPPVASAVAWRSEASAFCLAGTCHFAACWSDGSLRATCNTNDPSLTTWVHSSVVRAADCRSAGPWFKSGCALLVAKRHTSPSPSTRGAGLPAGKRVCVACVAQARRSFCGHPVGMGAGTL